MNNQKGNQPNTPLKEFNSTPIDTPTPVPLSDNLDPSKSLSEESLTIENIKSQPISEPEVPTESSTESLLEPETELKSTSEINPEPKTELDQENEVIPMSEVEPQPTPESNPEVELQPQPEPEVELKPEPDIEPKLDIEYSPEPLPTIETETKPPEPVSQDPEVVKQKIEEVLSYNSTNSVVNSKSDKPKTSRLLKTIFTISLIIFIAVVIGLVYFLLNPSLKNNPEPIATPTNTPVQSGATCELNGFIYTLNQSFPSADGCNTCTCVSADNIECTEKTCLGKESLESAIDGCLIPDSNGLIVYEGVSTTYNCMTYSCKPGNKLESEPSKEACTPSPISSPKPRDTSFLSPSSTLKLFQNKELNFGFQYPSSYGEIKIKTNSDGKGNAFYGTFTNNPEVFFGGISEDYYYNHKSTTEKYIGYIFNNLTSTGTFYNSETPKKVYSIGESFISNLLLSSEKGTSVVSYKDYDLEKDVSTDNTISIISLNSFSKNPIPVFAFSSKVSEIDIKQIISSIYAYYM